MRNVINGFITTGVFPFQPKALIPKEREPMSFNPYHFVRRQWSNTFKCIALFQSFSIQYNILLMWPFLKKCVVMNVDMRRAMISLMRGMSNGWNFIVPSRHGVIVIGNSNSNNYMFWSNSNSNSNWCFQNLCNSNSNSNRCPSNRSYLVPKMKQ